MTLQDMYETLPDKSKAFYDEFFTSETKEINDFFNIDFTKSVLHADSGIITNASLEIVFPKRAQTFGGRVHGGAIAFAFDAFMGIPLGFAKCLPEEKIIVMRELSSIEILKPVPTEQPLTIEAVCEKEDGRKFWFSSKIMQGEEVLATAKAFFISIPIPEK